MGQKQSTPISWFLCSPDETPSLKINTPRSDPRAFFPEAVHEKDNTITTGPNPFAGRLSGKEDLPSGQFAGPLDFTERIGRPPTMSERRDQIRARMMTIGAVVEAEEQRQRFQKKGAKRRDGRKTCGCFRWKRKKTKATMHSR